MTNSEVALREKIIQVMDLNVDLKTGGVEQETVDILADNLTKFFKTSNAEAYRQGQIGALSSIDRDYNSYQLIDYLDTRLAELKVDKEQE